MIARRPVLRCFPRADRAFEADAQRLLDDWLPELRGRHPDPDAFHDETVRELRLDGGRVSVGDVLPISLKGEGDRLSLARSRD